jgi:2-succinyl-5-enolpyruvyl-6-hydroxy-3-cyclohexene-1-carboxylate synthase
MNAPTPAAADVQASLCAALVDEWVRSGVTDAVLAPGSRSTPLVMALAADNRLRTHVVLDERSAGYVALGIGLAAARPAAVVTTSGTAAVELHPAVAEASYAGVPLLAVTADRPPELHGVGAPQTLAQGNLYGELPRWSVSFGPPDLGGAPSWRSLGARSVAEASCGPLGPGPVHLNLAFREPLVGSPSSVPAGRADGQPWHRALLAEAGALPDEAVQLLSSFAGARGMLVVGPGSRGDDQTVPALLTGAARLGWPVLAEPRSGYRLPAQAVVACADALLRCPAVASSAPELVVRVGAPWASKILGQWLSGLAPEVAQVLIDPWGRWADPDRRAELVVRATGRALADCLTRLSSAAGHDPGSWYQRWQRLEAAAQTALSAALDPGGPYELSEPAVARAVVDAAPEGSALVVSSSMPVRDVEWYGKPRSGLVVRSNRGVNGIDGVLSTAIGVALGHDSPTVALMGDLAFLYDAGALLGAGDRGVALTVIVVDNDGGGIFSFLSQAAVLDAPMFERYWGTPHGADLAAIASGYGADVVDIAERAVLDELVADSAKPGVRVGIVHSDRATNVDVHDRLHQAVAGAVAAI